MKFIRHNIATYLLLCSGLSMMISCSMFEPAKPVPSYLQIDSISLQTDYPTEGSNSKRIPDAWVIIDNKYLGTFPLPAEIPFIGEGPHSVIVRAGIIENGISSLRSAYPKYSSFESTVQFSPTSKQTIEPTIGYDSGVQFPQIEDFDDANLTFVTTTGGTADITITPQSDPNALEGNSGMVTLDSSHAVLEIASSTPFVLSLSTPSYVELNYKGDNDFDIGVFITTSAGVIKSSLISFHASTVWKKAYVNLVDLGGVVSNGIEYKIFLHAIKSNSLSTANIYFDNLKVVN